MDFIMTKFERNHRETVLLERITDTFFKLSFKEKFSDKLLEYIKDMYTIDENDNIIVYLEKNNYAKRVCVLDKFIRDHLENNL